MSEISAADNLSIEIQPQHWRLISNGFETAQVIAEAASGQPLRFSHTFATKRRLPATGILPSDQVQQVVIGWSQQDEAWHLGLVLSPELAEVRGSRWCELARWPDPDANLFLGLAKDAGQYLAQVLQRPLNIIHPQPNQQSAPPPPKKPLPLSLGLWRFEETAEGYQFKLSSRWKIGRLTRAAWYLFWAAIYFIISIATLTRGLALPNAGTMLPNPAILPYLGIASGVLLVLFALYQVYVAITQTDTIIIDPQAQLIFARRGRREHWRLAGAEVQSVYVTQVLDRDPKKHIAHHTEINLQGENGRFIYIAHHDQPVTVAPLPEGLALEDAIVPLSPRLAFSDAMHIGLYIAEALGRRPCYYDQRVK